MPPKKSRSLKSKNIEPNGKVSSVSIQTDNNYNFEAEALDYKKENEILKQELIECKLLITKLQTENNILKNQCNNDKLNETKKTELIKKNVLKVKNEKVASPILSTKNSKGCNCKGNCSSKICGCVKKGFICIEFCRCEHAMCRNREPEKENIEQTELSQDGQRTLEKFGRLTLNQESLHASNKKSKRGMFSPFGDRVGNGNTDKSYPASPLTFETRRRLFTLDSDDMVDVDNTDKDLSIAELKNNPEEKTQNVLRPQVQLLSQTPVAKRTRRLTSTERNDEVVKNDSPRATRSKSKSISPDNNVFRRKYKATSKAKSISVSPIDKNIQPTLGRVQHSPQSDNNLKPITIKQEIDFKNEKMNSITQNQMNTLSLNSSHNMNSRSFESNTSGNSSSSNNDFLDINFNPMVPKRQLARSPINATGSTIVLVDQKRFSPPKKELAVAEVNWEQHKSELVMCQICDRKFFPHRIEKHLKTCKGIKIECEKFYKI